MSSFDKKTKTSQQATTTTNLTDDTKTAIQSGRDAINGVLGRFNNDAYVPYGGPTVADLSANEVKARDMAGNLNPRAAVQYRTFDKFDPNAAMNPYEGAVVDAVGKRIDENLTKSINDNSLRATANGAYGGSRHGVADAELMRTANDDKAAVIADLRYKGYNDAADRFERESGNLYNADLRNSDAAYEDQFKTIDLLTKLGGTEREIEQAKLLAEKAKYDDAYADKWKRFQTELQTQIGLFGATPILTTTNSSGSSTSKTSDPIGTISSLANAAGGLFSGWGAMTNPPVS